MKVRYALEPHVEVPSGNRPTRVAQMLALAHLIERLVEAGDLKDYADAARRFGLSRARVSQVLDLTLLAPRIQEAVLAGPVVVAERRLRNVARIPIWSQQSM